MLTSYPDVDCMLHVASSDNVPFLDGHLQYLLYHVIVLFCCIIVGHKKRDTFIFVITLANVGRFL